MKVAGVCAAAIALPGCALPPMNSGSKEKRPNIIFIMADDLGWAELGCYGNRFNETPNIDRLAAKGMRFTQAYACAPVCSPYRAGLMTGQYPLRVGITDYLRRHDSNHLRPEQQYTIAEALRDTGYTTGLIGKWHLMGDYRERKGDPKLHGFDEVICSETQYIAAGYYYPPYKHMPQVEPRTPDEYLVDRLNAEAVEFIDRNQGKRFFLYLSHYAVHTRLVGKPHLVEKYSQRPDAGKDKKASNNNVHLDAQLETIDEGVGMIMEQLEQLGLAENTIVIFTSDNGGEASVTSNAPLRQGKSTLYEGGIRVPLIISWPERIKPGSLCKTPTSNIDFYPTFAQLAGAEIEPTHKTDGVSIAPLLKNPNAALARDTLYWHYPLKKPHFLGGRSSGAVRKGNWKHSSMTAISNYTTSPTISARRITSPRKCPSRPKNSINCCDNGECPSKQRCRRTHSEV
jgi:arylsulfatase A-like enzyme